MNEDVLYYPSKKKIEEAVLKFETPFFLYEESRLRKNCQNFLHSFRNYFPDFDPLYAVKTNSTPEIVKIINEEGFGLDCSSPTEAWLAGKLDIGGIYTGNFTPSEELAFAKKNNLILNLDDISMIPFLEKIGVPDTVFFRINPGVNQSSNKSLVFAGPDAKFGIPFEQAADAYNAAKKIGVKKFGIHMMTGSNVLDEDYFAIIVARLLEIVAGIKEKTGIDIDFLNMGGGFGVPYKPEEKNLDMNKVAKGVRSAIDTQCKKYKIKEPKLLAEPGRYLTANAGWLIAKVIVIKNGYKKFVGIDASSNDMPRPSIYGAYHHVSIINNQSNFEKINIVGRLCENNDQLAKNRTLPKTQIGDVILIHNSGGHAFSMGHNYNGRLRHAEYLIKENGNFQQIRRAETIEDYFQTINLKEI